MFVKKEAEMNNLQISHRDKLHSASIHGHS